MKLEWTPWSWAEYLAALVLCHGDWLHDWRFEAYVWFAARSFGEEEMAEMRKAGLL